ncbi:MAG: PEP-CTERM sorting domain-containing protein, partial [Nitrosospira sp.]|nr:PEP-CTERM sorting domain-containing protein [Nitrosospira sp.]
PPIAKWAITHDLSKETFSAAYIPVAEWRNPVGDGAIVNVGGSLLLTWEGMYTENAPAGTVDVAVARMDASTGFAELLYSTTLTNPAEGGELLWPGISDAPPVEIRNAWGATGVRMDEGDTLRFTLRLRGDEADPALWALLDDQSTSITLTSVVPEPEQFILLTLGLGVLAMRLRRRNGLTNRAGR